MRLGLHGVSTVIGLLLGMMAWVSCSQPPPPPSCELYLPSTTANPEWIEEVRNCPKQPPTPSFARVQLLIDNSGSMSGFQNVMPTVQLWLRQSLSSLLGSHTAIKAPSRACYFNQRLGIGDCVDLAGNFGGGFKPFVASANTNFHDAILSARNFDITVIATDGVDFTGSGTGNCAGGIDASCVAGSLSEVLRIYDLSGTQDAGGAWLVPIVSGFSGTYYTEQNIRVQDFNQSEVSESVRNEVRQDIRIEDVQQRHSGELTYTYRGPREWFLLVIARPAALGRATVHSLWGQANKPGIYPVEDISSWRDGLGVFRPVEIFPGYLPRSTLASFQLLGIDGKVSGEEVPGKTYCPTIDIGWSPTANISSPASEISIGSVTQGEALRRLTLFREEPPSQCSPLSMIMPFQMQLEGRAIGNSSAPIHAYSLSWNEGRIDLHLVGDAKSQLPECKSSTETEMAWVAEASYDKAADCLISDGCISSSSVLIRKLNGHNTATEPHRIFGLLPTVQAFLNRSSGKSQKLKLAEFRLCRPRR